MNIEAEKLSLIQWLTQVTDADIISKLKAVRANESDWWDTITIEEREAIEEGLAEADSGELQEHKEVMTKFNKWL